MGECTSKNINGMNSIPLDSTSRSQKMQQEQTIQKYLSKTTRQDLMESPVSKSTAEENEQDANEKTNNRSYPKNGPRTLITPSNASESDMDNLQRAMNLLVQSEPVKNQRKSSADSSSSQQMSRLSSEFLMNRKKYVAGLSVISEVSRETTIRRGNSFESSNNHGNFGNNPYQFHKQVVKEESFLKYGPSIERNLHWAVQI